MCSVKKIAVCIPSYNEKENIQNITAQVDLALDYFKDDEFIKYIVNCDNSSPDKTNDFFNSTKTKHEKVSIIANNNGKGVNIRNFFKFVLDNEIDYSFTIDADLRSFKVDWLIKMYEKLNEEFDYIVPNYKRRKEEGNTTNHFVVPVLYNVYGKFIRQPIAGDFAFNKKFVEEIMKEDFSPYILRYGIDIFMTVTAIVKNLKITEVNLEEKIHAPSYKKMDVIFENVLRAFSEVYRHYKPTGYKEDIKYEPFIYENRICEFREEINDKYLSSLKEIEIPSNYDDILNYWVSLLKDFITEVEDPPEELISKMKDAFICRTVSFWDEMERRQKMDWEKELIEMTYLVGRK